MNKIIILLLSLLLLLLGGEQTLASSTVIKISLITPEGSTWTDALYRMTREIEVKTQDAVSFKIYAGGISGDELDVLRKMRIGRIHAAGFSGVGLGIIAPRARILEAPLLFKNHREIDLVREALFDELAADFEKNGFVLLGFAEAGFVYFFFQIQYVRTPGI